MSAWLKRVLILLVLSQQFEAFGCRFNVRDVGFVDLGSEPYRLYLFVGDEMPTAERESLQSIAVATYYDTNVKAEVLTLGQVRQTEAKVYLPSGFTGETPTAVLVSPDQQSTLPVPLAKAGKPIMQTAWDGLESVIDSPRRNAVLESVFSNYGVVLIVEGDDAEMNERVRSMANEVVLEIAGKMGDLEKEIQKPPVVEVILAKDVSSEQAFLWSLGIQEVLESPQVAILYGRGRMIGPVLRDQRLDRVGLSAVLNTIGLNCECGLDRKWMQGPMVPLKWDRDRKQEIAKQLGFNPESPEIRIEMSQILAKGGPGQGINRSKIVGDTLDELLTGFRTGNLAANYPPEPGAKPIGQAAGTDEPPAPGFPMSGWITLAGVTILAIGGVILLTARRREL